MYIYIYIYTYREREGEKDTNDIITMMISIIITNTARGYDFLGRPLAKFLFSEGGMIRLDTLIELKFLSSRFMNSNLWI